MSRSLNINVDKFSDIKSRCNYILDTQRITAIRDVKKSTSSNTLVTVMKPTGRDRILKVKRPKREITYTKVP